MINKLQVINVGNGNNEYPGNFTKKEIKIIKHFKLERTLHLFSGKSNIGEVRVDFTYGNIKKDVFYYLESLQHSYY